MPMNCSTLHEHSSILGSKCSKNLFQSRTFSYVKMLHAVYRVAAVYVNVCITPSSKPSY